MENSSQQGWIVDGKLNIDPKREEFLDLSKELKDNNQEVQGAVAHFHDRAGGHAVLGAALAVQRSVGPHVLEAGLGQDVADNLDVTVDLG